MKYRKKYANYIFKDYKSKIKIFLPGSTSKSDNYDKYRDTGYVKNQQNWLTVKALVRDTTASELVYKTIGIHEIGAKKIVIKNNDVNLFKLASYVTIDEEQYYVFNDAVGNKMQIQKLDDNYSEITLFKKDV